MSLLAIQICFALLQKLFTEIPAPLDLGLSYRLYPSLTYQRMYVFVISHHFSSPCFSPSKRFQKWTVHVSVSTESIFVTFCWLQTPYCCLTAVHWFMKRIGHFLSLADKILDIWRSIWWSVWWVILNWTRQFLNSLMFYLWSLKSITRLVPPVTLICDIILARI